MGLTVAEKIIEFVARNNKLEAKSIYRTIMDAIKEDYEGLYPFFEDIINEEASLDDIKLDKKLIDEINECVKQRIKPPEVFVEGVFEISSASACISAVL